MAGLAACLVWVPAGKAAEPFVIAKSGRPMATIVTADNAGEQRLSLAEELRHWLQRVTGASLPVESGGNGQTGLVMGTAGDFPREAKNLKLQELGPEGFVIRSGPERLVILGNTELALQHAVFAFLESLGCRWFFPDPVWTVMPRKPDLSVRLDRRERPAYDYRQIWYGWAAQTPALKEHYQAWARHNLMFWNESPLPPAFQVDTSHSYIRHVPRDLFKDHPEYFSLIDGQRQPRQLCVSNEAVQDRVIESVLNKFRITTNLNMVSVDPNDGGNHCECNPCKELGTISDRVFHLANQAADAVRKEFPQKWVGLNGYHLHSDPPNRPIHPGVYVSVTTRFRHTDFSFDDQVRRFKELGAAVGVYEYFSVYPWDWDMPGAALGGRARMLGYRIRKYYKELNVVTLNAESSCNWGPNGLGYWVASKMMWNPNLKPEELAQDFYVNAFGKAATPMKRLYERWNRGDGFVIRQGVKAALDDLAEAYRAEKDPAVGARLDRVAMYVHWLRLNDDYVESVIHHNSEDVVHAAREMIAYSRRIMDTGLIHTFPMLLVDTWFENRFSTLKTIKSFDWQQTEAWKTERTDIPTPAEAAENFAADQARYQDVQPVAFAGQVFSDDLVPVEELLPDAVREWGAVERSAWPMTSGELIFRAKKGSVVRLDYQPVEGSPPIDAHWKLRPVGDSRILAEGDVTAPQGQPATCEIPIPVSGLLVIVPGQSEATLCAADVTVGPGRHAAFAGRYWDRDPEHLVHDEFTLWRPTFDDPLYFFVPKGTGRFVIGLDGARKYSTLVLKSPTGHVYFENDQIMQAIPSYQLVGERVAVIVPQGEDGKIWSLSLESYRCRVELYDIPPYLARHPAELLAPREVLH